LPFYFINEKPKGDENVFLVLGLITGIQCNTPKIRTLPVTDKLNDNLYE